MQLIFPTMHFGLRTCDKLIIYPIPKYITKDKCKNTVRNYRVLPTFWGDNVFACLSVCMLSECMFVCESITKITQEKVVIFILQ